MQFEELCAVYLAWNKRYYPFTSHTEGSVLYISIFDSSLQHDKISIPDKDDDNHSLGQKTIIKSVVEVHFLRLSKKFAKLQQFTVLMWDYDGGGGYDVGYEGGGVL